MTRTTGQNQVLDSLQVEKERGITVKAQTASLLYEFENKIYLLNLIDTPGHVDFSNEVSRSLAACDGVVLLVDANHGVQAQTVANYFLAVSRNLTVVPVLNKIDLKHANPERVCQELESIFDIKPETVLKVNPLILDKVLNNNFIKLDISKERHRNRRSFKSCYSNYSTTNINSFREILCVII